MAQNSTSKKDDNIVNLDKIDLDSYELLVLPGGVKSMELLRLDNFAINTVRKFNKKIS